MAQETTLEQPVLKPVTSAEAYEEIMAKPAPEREEKLRQFLVPAEKKTGMKITAVTELWPSTPNHPIKAEMVQPDYNRRYAVIMNGYLELQGLLSDHLVLGEHNANEIKACVENLWTLEWFRRQHPDSEIGYSYVEEKKVKDGKETPERYFFVTARFDPRRVSMEAELPDALLHFDAMVEQTVEMYIKH